MNSFLRSSLHNLMSLMVSCVIVEILLILVILMVMSREQYAISALIGSKTVKIPFHGAVISAIKSGHRL